MPQFDLPLCRIGRNVAHRVRRYICLFVASELVSDVESFTIDQERRTQGATLQGQAKMLIRLRRISAFLPPASLGVSSGGSL